LLIKSLLSHKTCLQLLREVQGSIWQFSFWDV